MYILEWLRFYLKLKRIELHYLFNLISAGIEVQSRTIVSDTVTIEVYVVISVNLCVCVCLTASQLQLHLSYFHLMEAFHPRPEEKATTITSPPRLAVPCLLDRVLRITLVWRVPQLTLSKATQVSILCTSDNKFMYWTTISVYSLSLHP